MAYQKERDTFINIMTEEGVPLETTRLILRDAATVQRFAIEDCNRPLTDDERKRWEQAELRIIRRLMPFEITVNDDYDPRGYATKLFLKFGKNNTMGDDGYGVPNKHRW